MASEPNKEGTLLIFPSDSDDEDIPKLQSDDSDDSVDDEIKQASIEGMLTSPQITGK
jgi:hypothetical protein